MKVICYNFMPVFDWTRSDLFKPRADGATVLAYDQAVIDKITDPQDFADRIQQGGGRVRDGRVGAGAHGGDQAPLRPVSERLP